MTLPQNDLPRAKAPDQVLGDSKSILRHALECQHRPIRWRITAVRPACAALVPLYEREVLLPGAEEAIGVGAQRVARSAVEKENHRVRTALAPDGDPLLDTPHAYELLLVNRLSGRNTSCRR